MLISDQNFYSLTKEAVSHAKPRQVFESEMMLNAERVCNIPIPVFNKIINGELKLLSYRLYDGDVDALSSFIERNTE